MRSTAGLLLIVAIHVATQPSLAQNVAVSTSSPSPSRDVVTAEASPTPSASVAELASPYGSVKWDYSPLGVYGPTYTSPDQQNRLTMGLYAWFDNSFVVDADELADALGRPEIDGESRIATARLELNGSYAQDYWYLLRIDFQDNGSGSGNAAVELTAVGFNDLPLVQNLIVGLQMPTYGLDIWANNPRYRPMLEPSLANAFFHGTLLGITAYDVDLEHKLSWALGVARDTSEESSIGLQAVDKGEDDFIVHGRVSFLPHYREQGRYMLHLGLSGALIKPEDERLIWGIWPEIYTDDLELYPLVIIDDAKKSLLGVLELRYVDGPFWLQSEYFLNRTERDVGDDLRFSAFYVETGYFFTGHQTLFSPLAINGQVLPTPRAHRKLGEWGAWEIQARYSQLDLRSKELQGGAISLGDGAEVTNYTLGLNWFLNAHIKIGVSYVHSVREDLDDAKSDIIQTRLAWSI